LVNNKATAPGIDPGIYDEIYTYIQAMINLYGIIHREKVGSTDVLLDFFKRLPIYRNNLSIKSLKYGLPFREIKNEVYPT